MNKVYRVVWNAATGTWAAVQETAKACKKSSRSATVGQATEGASTKVAGKLFALTMVMSGLLIATGQVAYAATVADGTGLNAIVIQGASSTATATGADSLAAGTNAAADGNSALAIGTDSKATGAYATAVGANVTAGGLNSITIGSSNNVTGRYTTVIGSGNIPKDGKGLDAAGGIVDVTAADTITATHSSIIGKSNQIAVSSVIGIPQPYADVLTDVQVQGNDNIINRGHAYVFGSNNTINTDASNMELESVVAVGRQNTVSGNNSLAVGRLNTVAGDSALAVGMNSQALGRDGIAIGNKAYANRGENPVALGGLTHAGQFGTALGARTSVEGDQGLAAATGAVVKGARAVAVGSYSFAGPEDAVALGHNTAATGSRAVAMGAGSVVSGARSGAWGIATNGGQPQKNTTDRSFVGGADSYAIGNKNIIGNTSSDSFVLGNNVKLGATGASIAITNVAGRDGTTNASTRTNAVTYTGATAITGAVALGSDTSVTVDNGVALGKGSVASTAAGQAGTDPLSAKDATASAGVWTATHAAVSVGNGTTVTRQITSVAAGTQDTDAVNVAQLKAAGFTLKATSSTGGEATTVADDKIQNGETVTVDAGKNIKVTHTANQVSIATKDEVEFDKVTVGSVVVDAANNDITGLANTTLGAADFATAGRAATEEQLSLVSDSVVDIIGGGVTNVGGAVTGPFTANGTNYDNIAEAIEGESAAAKTEVEEGKNISVTSTTGTDGQTIYTVATADEVEFDKVTVGSVVVDAANNDITGLANTTLGAADFATAGRAATEEQLSLVSDSVVDIIGGGVTNVGGAVTGPFTANGTNYDNIAEAIEGESAAAKTEVEEGKNISVTSTTGTDGQTIYTVATADEVEFDKVTVGSVVVDAANNDITGLANTTLGAADFATAGRAATEEQLSLVSDSVVDIIGGGVTNVGGAVTGPFTANGTNYDNIAEAIEGESAAAKTEVEEGKNISVTSTTGTDGQTIYTVATADEVEFDKVTVGSVVVDAANNDITGLANTTLGAADFATAGRAATEEQLSLVSDSVVDIIGGGVTNVGGAVTGPFTANGTNYDNIAEAIEGESAAAKTEVEEGKNISVTSTTGTDGQTIYTVATADEVEFDKVTVGSVVVDAANNDITGLANTTLGAADFATAGRAATEEQLSLVSDSVVDIIGGGVTNVGGAVTGPFTANGTNYDNIAEAIEGESAAAKTEVEEGKNISVTSTTGTDGQTIYTVATADEVEFDKVTVGSVVVDAANNDITGLANTTLGAADFATAGRAATEEQLSLVSDSVVDIIGGGVTNVGGAVTGPFTANGTNYDNIAEAIEGESAAAKTEVEEGKNISVTSTTGTDGQTIYTVATADEVEFDKVTVGSVVVDAANNDITGLANTTLGAADFATAGRAATEEQLSLVSDSVVDIIGGGVTNVGGAVTGPFTANGTNYDNIAEAIEGESAAAKTEVEEGKNISVTSTTGTDGQTIYTVATADEVEFDKVTVGSVVVDAANNDITGLANTTLGAADFATAGRAATEEQLSLVSDSVVDIIGGGVTNVGGAVTGPFTANGTNYDNIAEAIEGESAAAKTEVEEGKNISVTSTTGTDGQTIYTVATADEVEFDKVTVGSVVVDAANNDITGLANTTLGAADFATAGRAATEEQLSLVSDSVVDIIGGGVTNVGGAVTGPFTANGTNYDNIAEAIEGESAAAKTEVEEGKNISVTSTTGTDGQTIYTVATADEVEFDKVTVGSVVVDAANNDITGLANTTLGAADFATAGRAATEEQLSLVSDSVVDIIGGGVTNVGGAVTGPFTANGTNYDNIAEAIEGESAAAKTEVEEGKNISVTSTTGTDGQTIYTVATADEVEFDKVTVGSVVVDAANNDITGLANTTLGAADFATAGRAATEEQLSLVSDSVVDIIGGGVTNVGGAVTGPFTANGTNYDNIAEAIEGESAAAKTEVEEGKNISVTSTTGTDGQTIYTVATADEVEFDKVTVGSVVVDAANNDITGLANTTLGAADFATAGRAATEEQLSLVSDSVVDIIGGGVTNVGGAVTGPFTANGTNYDNIAEAIEGESAAAKTEVEEGKNISVTSTTGTDGQTIYTVATADEVEFDKVTVGNTTITTDGLTIVGGPSVTKSGIDAGDKKITNVADGVISATSKDAVNGSQLYQAVNNINTSIAASKEEVKSADGSVTVTTTQNAKGANVYDLSVNTDGTTIKKNADGSLAVNTTPLTNNADGTVKTPTAPNAIATAGDIANAINNSGFTLTAKGSNGSLVKPGATVDMNNTDGNIVISKSASDNKVTYNLAKDLKVDSVTAGDTVVNNDGITINNGSANGNTVSLTKDGLNNGGNRITNVAPGVDATDAVNVSQLQGLAHHINNRIDDVSDDANAGVSSAMAMAALPQAYIPGKSMLTGGIASYNGEGAVAVGFSKLSDNGRWVLKVSGSADTEGNAGGAVGAGFHF